MSDVKDPPDTGAFSQILAAAGVAPLRKAGEPAVVSVPQLAPATRRESREQLRNRADRRAKSTRAAAASRASALDWSALALSIVLPPVGLLVSVAAQIHDRRRVGWASTVTKMATAVGCVLTVVVAAGAVVALDLRSETAAHDAIVSSSVAFCSAVGSSDGLLASDTFGWPAVGATIPLTITAMEEYTASWTSIAAVAPDGIRGGAESMAAAAQTATDSVIASRTVDNAGNIAQLQSAAANSGITTWVAEYCE